MKGGLHLDRRGIGRRVRARRLELDLSQREVARGLTISYAYLSRIESGDRMPSLGVLVELGTALRTTALALAFGGNEPPICPVCGRAAEHTIASCA